MPTNTKMTQRHVGGSAAAAAAEEAEAEAEPDEFAMLEAMLDM